jgi:hypothetical protein
MTNQLFTLLIVLAAVISITALCAMCRHERDAYDGKRLRLAAGSRERIDLAIEEVRIQRALEERLQRELDDALTFKRLDKVTPFRQLRVVSKGVPVHFANDGGDAA